MHGQCTAKPKPDTKRRMARKRQSLQRLGKVARLPIGIRDRLNAHMLDGWPGDKLLRWLHEQPEVRAVLAEHFAGVSITHQNLSVWRHGGYAEWLRARERHTYLYRGGQSSRP